MANPYIPAYPGSPEDLAQQRASAAANTPLRRLKRTAGSVMDEVVRAAPAIDLPLGALAGVPGAVRNFAGPEQLAAAGALASSALRRAATAVPLAASGYAAYQARAGAAPLPTPATGSSIRSRMGLRR